MSTSSDNVYREMHSKDKRTRTNLKVPQCAKMIIKNIDNGDGLTKKVVPANTSSLTSGVASKSQELERLLYALVCKLRSQGAEEQESLPTPEGINPRLEHAATSLSRSLAIVDDISMILFGQEL